MNSLSVIKNHLKKELDNFISVSNLNKITDTNLDNAVLKFLKNKNFESPKLSIKFSQPKDTIYRIEGGRSPYDLLVSGDINKIPFKIFLNNKLGNLTANSRNDTTTYNNLLRLYLGIETQRLSNSIIINKNLILNRVAGEEIVAYAIFVIDKNSNNFNLFYLEEIEDEFYVNPRNSMFQVSYSPNLRKEAMDYYDFTNSLISASVTALKRLIVKAKTEIIALENIRKILLELKRGKK